MSSYLRDDDARRFYSDVHSRLQKNIDFLKLGPFFDQDMLAESVSEEERIQAAASSRTKTIAFAMHAVPEELKSATRDFPSPLMEALFHDDACFWFMLDDMAVRLRGHVLGCLPIPNFGMFFSDSVLPTYKDRLREKFSCNPAHPDYNSVRRWAEAFKRTEFAVHRCQALTTKFLSVDGENQLRTPGQIVRIFPFLRNLLPLKGRDTLNQAIRCSRLPKNLVESTLPNASELKAFSLLITRGTILNQVPWPARFIADLPTWEAR